MSNQINAAYRVLQILASFDSEGRDLSVGRIADTLGVHKSTASRLAATLVQRGFLERKKRALRLGPEVGRLGLLALNSRDLVTIARKPMEWLSSKTGETIHLAVLEGGEAVNIAQVDGPSIVGIGNWIGRRTKLHCAANGKVLLAFSGRDLIRGPLSALTARTITNPETLRAQVKEIRAQGWAGNIGELEEGLHAVAVPVLDGSHRCRAALSVSGPSYRMPPDRFPKLAEACRTAARSISFRLGACS